MDSAGRAAREMRIPGPPRWPPPQSEPPLPRQPTFPKRAQSHRFAQRVSRSIPQCCPSPCQKVLRGPKSGWAGAISGRFAGRADERRRREYRSICRPVAEESQPQCLDAALRTPVARCGVTPEIRGPTTDDKRPGAACQSTPSRDANNPLPGSPAGSCALRHAEQAESNPSTTRSRSPHLRVLPRIQEIPVKKFTTSIRLERCMGKLRESANKTVLAMCIAPCMDNCK